MEMVKEQNLSYMRKEEAPAVASEQKDLSDLFSVIGRYCARECSSDFYEKKQTVYQNLAWHIQQQLKIKQSWLATNESFIQTLGIAGY